MAGIDRKEKHDFCLQLCVMVNIKNYAVANEELMAKTNIRYCRSRRVFCKLMRYSHDFALV